jgi:hypothetical protein
MVEDGSAGGEARAAMPLLGQQTLLLFRLTSCSSCEAAAGHQQLASIHDWPGINVSKMSFAVLQQGCWHLQLQY